MKKLSNLQKWFYYIKRKRIEDINYLHMVTGYSKSHLYNIINGNRTLNKYMADTLYLMCFRRKRNIDLINNKIK